MTAEVFTPRASRELSAAAAWIAEETPEVAENLAAALVAAKRVLRRMGGRTRRPLSSRRMAGCPRRGNPVGHCSSHDVSVVPLQEDSHILSSGVGNL
jgi:plasmid stabilization system protein ParE